LLLVTHKNILSERTRLAISVGGVALSVLLITFLLSLYRGWNERVGGFVENVDADIWIAREGTTRLPGRRFHPSRGGGRTAVYPAIG
jgi:hypothetical protein